ncbi:glutaminyl-peptide cyclotransferase [Sphingomonas mollis]|uniref:glutaminyl-peptide cyclotransferase n=1 Tax=Sphingomonas mollis TaxID=2795726 RepID=UPI001E50BB60|nr:glutaminyl-peptide cyclotransferase [Sphingomonas sp. BT553]
MRTGAPAIFLAAAMLVPSMAFAQARPAAAAPAATRVPMTGVTVVARYPHDATAFTEGLIWHDGALYESVGREGQSDVRRVRLADGKVERRGTIPPAQFGEGLAAWRNELVSLTWHDGIAHRWDPKTLKRHGQSRYVSEGWGLTGDGRALIQSDGTATLRFLDPATLKVRRQVSVTLNGRPLDQINELEWVDGAILANIWHQPFLVRIDPASGRVTRIIDLRPLVAEIAATDPEAVANGIAYDAAKKRLFVTGKLWPTVFEIRLSDR